MRHFVLHWALILLWTSCCGLNPVGSSESVQTANPGHTDGCERPVVAENCTFFREVLQDTATRDHRTVVISGLVSCDNTWEEAVVLRGDTVIMGCENRCATPVLDWGALIGKIVLVENATLEFRNLIITQKEATLGVTVGLQLHSLRMQGSNRLRVLGSVIAADSCRSPGFVPVQGTEPRMLGRKVSHNGLGKGSPESDFTINNATVISAPDAHGHETGEGEHGEVIGEIGDLSEDEAHMKIRDAVSNRQNIITYCHTVMKCGVVEMGVQKYTLLSNRLAEAKSHQCRTYDACQRGELSGDGSIVDESGDGSGISVTEIVVAVLASVFIIILLLFATKLSTFISRGKDLKKEATEPAEKQGCENNESCAEEPGNAGEAEKVDKSTWVNVDIKDVEFLAVIGKGGFGKVYKAKYEGELVAIKIVNHGGGFQQGRNEPLEAYFSKNIKHRNVVRTYLQKTRKRGVSEVVCITPLSQQQSARSSADGDWLSYITGAANEIDLGDFRTWMIMEYCDKGNLFKAIQDREFFDGHKGVQQPDMLKIVLTAQDITSAMAYLHSLDIIHGDLKAQNVLLQTSEQDKRGFTCKVADFGMSRSLHGESYIQTFTFGTISHMPPELLSDGILTPATDIYSFGILLWELISGQSAYPNEEYSEIILEVVNGRRPIIPEDCPPSLALLMRDCWHQDYRIRPTFEEIADRLDNIFEFTMAVWEDNQESLLMQGDVGVSSQERPVPSFLLGMRSIEPRPSVIDDTAFAITPTEEPEGYVTGSSGGETYRSLQ